MLEIGRQIGVEVRKLDQGDFTVRILIDLIHKLVEDLFFGLFTVSVRWVTL